ncbi:hypothetical protein MAHJHV61_25910 [Mycobacterium avium subsp. hominissuis]
MPFDAFDGQDGGFAPLFPVFFVAHGGSGLSVLLVGSGDGVGQVVTDAVVEFENGEHRGYFEVFAAGRDVDAGDEAGGDAGVAAVEGEYGCQRERFDAGLAVEVVSDAAP